MWRGLFIQAYVYASQFRIFSDIWVISLITFIVIFPSHPPLPFATCIEGRISSYSTCRARRWFSWNYVVLGGPWQRLLPWWRHKMETFSALLASCEGNPPVTGGFPSQGSVTRNFDVLFDLRLHKRFSKQWRPWWFETPSLSLWRRDNALMSLPSTAENIVFLLISGKYCYFHCSCRMSSWLIILRWVVVGIVLPVT